MKKWTIASLCVLLTGCATEVPVEKLMPHSVFIDIKGVDASGQIIDRIVIRAGDKQITRGIGGSGTGFVIGDSKHILTNYHVCCEVEDEIQIGNATIRTGVVRNALFLKFPNQKPILAKTIWSSMRKDIAVLELEKPLDIPPVTFLPTKHVSIGQKTWIIGFPGQNTEDTDSASDLIAKPYPSDIVGKVRMDNNAKRGLWVDIDMFQTNSLTGPGASGSPVFDLCGRVIAIHARGMGSGKQGVKYEVVADEILPELERLKISVPVESMACYSGSQTVVAGATVSGGALVFAAVLIATTRRGRDMVRRVTSRRQGIPLPPHAFAIPAKSPAGGPPPPPPPPGSPASLKPVLKGMAGYYKGNALEMSGEAFTIGRDGKTSQLVYPPDTDSVSRKHCSIRYDAAKKKFLLEDYGSTNGTFLQNGEKLSTGRAYELSSGDQFYLGNKDNMFEVRLEVQG